MGKTYDFIHDEAKKADFVSDGLRKYFEYRDLGLSEADEIITAVSGRMSSALSQSDLIARFGGDEYAVLLPEVDLTTARAIASRLRRSVTDAPIKTSHGPVYVTVSVGVASTNGPGTKKSEASLEGLIHDADGAMYRAKRSGRDRIEVATNKNVPVRRTTNN